MKISSDAASLPQPSLAASRTSEASPHATSTLADSVDRGHMDPLAVMLGVFQDAMKDITSDQAYWTEKLEGQNQMSDALAGYADARAEEDSEGGKSGRP